MLGIEPCKARTGYAKFDVAVPPLDLTLDEHPATVRGALSHMGVASTEAVFAVRSRWQGAGLETRDEMRTKCCHAIQDKTCVSDPDGNEWEVFVVLQDDLEETTMCRVTGSDEATSAAESSCRAPAAPVALRRR
jgi:hypothetical protein